MKSTKLSRGLAVIALMAGALAGCATTEVAETYVTIDINPSVGLMINEDGQVSLAHALNADGEMVMLQLQLEGKKAEAAMAEIVGEATQLQFINPDATSTSVQIDCIGSKQTVQTRTRNEVEAHVNAAFEGVMAQAQVQTRAYNDSETSEAQHKGTNPLRWRLMKQAMIGNDELTEEEALAMDTEALLAKVKAGATQMKAIASSYGQEFLEAREAIHDEYLPQIQALRQAIEEAEAAGSSTEDLEAQLAALETAMRDALKALVDDFKERTVTAREQWQTMAEGIKAGGSSHESSSETGNSTGNQSS